MKKIGFAIVMLVGLVFMASSFTYDKHVAPNSLPKTAQQFLKKNFSDRQVVLIEKDVQFLGVKYEVTLNDGSELNFDTNGEWTKIDCIHQAIPTSAIPETIYNYVSAKFPAASIVEINKGHRIIKVELSNNIDLRFNMQGQIVGYDD